MFGSSALSSVFTESFLPVLGASSGEQNLLNAFSDYSSGALLSDQTLFGLFNSTSGIGTSGDSLYAALSSAYSTQQSSLADLLGSQLDISA
ncbi:MAG: hypothetical protein GC134_06790 [Proteobacteria bacterium]|nr:hypothetical protein [Pseudomonadota bacterium]